MRRTDPDNEPSSRRSWFVESATHTPPSPYAIATEPVSCQLGRPSDGGGRGVDPFYRRAERAGNPQSASAAHQAARFALDRDAIDHRALVLVDLEHCTCAGAGHPHVPAGYSDGPGLGWELHAFGRVVGAAGNGNQHVGVAGNGQYGSLAWYPQESCHQGDGGDSGGGGRPLPCPVAPAALNNRHGPALGLRRRGRGWGQRLVVLEDALLQLA